MRKYVILLALVAALTGCGKEPGQTVYVPTPPAAEPAPSDIQVVVDDENDYRLSLGQTALSQGLSCTVQQVASGQWLSSGSPGYPGSGVVVMTGTSYSFLLSHEINQPDASGSTDNMVLPSAIAPMFRNLNYRITCSGQLVVTETGYYSFALASDDGSILTIAGSQVINNDGNHGVVEKLGTKLLRRGVHSLSISYAQTGSGNMALILKANGSVIPGEVFYH